MMHQLLPEVDRHIDLVKAALLSSEKGTDPTFVVDGDASAGKTSLLMALRDELRNQGHRHAVFVSPPAGALEVGALALLEVLGELENAGLEISSVRNLVQDPRVSWRDKIRATRESLRENESSLVLLLDEPARWRGADLDTLELGQHAIDVHSMLLNFVRCPKIVTGPLRQGAADRIFQLSPASAPPSRTVDPRFWGAMASAAQSLFSAIPDLLSRRTPLEVRLLVALAFVEGADEVAHWLLGLPNPRTRRDIVGHVHQTLRNNPKTLEVADLWAQLALERRPFADELLERIGLRQLSKESQDILTIGLLYRDREGWVLHEMLKSEVDRWWTDASKRQAIHAQLADYHKSQFEELSGLPDTTERDHRALLLHEAEAVHQATQAGDIDRVDQLRVYFVDQLNILGRTLSKDLGRHADAVAVYERVLKHDEVNAYARHYLAYNLDVQGIQPDRVEAGYRTSLDLEPTALHWHAHWICFLIVRGRTSDARTAWDRAQDAVATASSAAREEAFRQLHRPVLRLLVHRALLEFARALIELIPKAIVQETPELRGLERRIRALESALVEPAVFPITIPFEQRWKNGPHLCGWQHAGHHLARWLAARVENVDTRGRKVRLLTARKSAEGDDPAVAQLELSWDDFNRVSDKEKASDLEPGRFLELAVYSDNGDEIMVCRLHPPQEDLEYDLSPLWPSPDRYLRTHAGADPARPRDV